MTKLERMTAAVAKGQEMRKLQKEYFSTRDRDVLGRSKLAEREFDKLATAAMDDRLGD